MIKEIRSWLVFICFLAALGWILYGISRLVPHEEVEILSTDPNTEHGLKTMLHYDRHCELSLAEARRILRDTDDSAQYLLLRLEKQAGATPNVVCINDISASFTESGMLVYEADPSRAVIGVTWNEEAVRTKTVPPEYLGLGKEK